jgi:hypothetical protein
MRKSVFLLRDLGKFDRRENAIAWPDPVIA